MDAEGSQSTEASEAQQAPTEAPVAKPQKPPRTMKQLESLRLAREKALKMRVEKAELSRKEKEVAKATAERDRQERAAKIQAEFDALKAAPVQEETPVPKKRKPARRIIVHEASSGEEDDDTVDVVLPRERKPPSAAEVQYQRTLNKMFYYD